jgi:hypothetical protein
MKLRKKLVILLKMTRTEGLRVESFIRRASTMRTTGMKISIMEILLLMMLLLYQQNCRLHHGPILTSHPDPKQFLMSYEATISSYGGNTAVMAKSFVMAVLHKPGTPLFGQEQSPHGKS